MTSRVTGLLALVGGTAWMVKVALIWENGGTNTTEGLVGALFTVGAVAIVLALAARVWLVSSRSVSTRLLAVMAVVACFALAVNLPILLGWIVFGRTWLAEEVGVILVAVGALVLGVRWLGDETLAGRV
ncbi:MAG TPA: hypothetical protein VGD39_02920 [Nocardioides sp.]